MSKIMEMSSELGPKMGARRPGDAGGYCCSVVLLENAYQRARRVSISEKRKG